MTTYIDKLPDGPVKITDIETGEEVSGPPDSIPGKVVEPSTGELEPCPEPASEVGE